MGRTPRYRGKQVRNGNIYTCHLCGHKSNDQSNNVRHMKMHLGIKQYECSACGRKFSQSGNCKSHIRNKCSSKAMTYSNPMTEDEEMRLQAELQIQRSKKFVKRFTQRYMGSESSESFELSDTPTPDIPETPEIDEAIHEWRIAAIFNNACDIFSFA